MPPKGAKKKQPGENVRMFLQRQEELQKFQQQIHEQDQLKAFAYFENKALKKQASEAATRAKKAGVDELECLDIEVKTRRRACLKEFYEQQNQRYAKELEAMGLALSGDRY
uniref:Uncharacterized protein n=1 Tax=Rhizochromulina marina TaxID=1034831 RepID=A0A7S2S799_9STRA|mmetsp:Transcript_25498/g.74353  ORF Transcript_25498/g.74353 Transcript_25498/m.74353 type:complete len:111 (+) Transcript_25498:39-371(+)